ncbi:adenosylcobinamide-GDP ribazoletransferase [Nonomuraea turkmeniaca]|uniref:Adenosylcobinamide-GDP ribazoletransferase n=1 Tax=Nonomuraea turkmeniaca TaxID=103838 RepID=A0A5S4EWX9_9ACTN|nr:adenosylcobinamide-GDP ribazoletransferase [Nonomuraea turkmeniaca]TMR07973.1 adenosylcobinamide-GDP ribazoletransferase [Nonomuraea turkmeniaca]
MRLMHGLRFAVGTLSVFPVRVERADREVAGRAMTLAPLVGLTLGAVAGLPLGLPAPALLGAALAIGLLAVLTRGLHLDGLADLADGLGSGKPADQALDIMKKSDIGPFGVMALVFTLLVQVAALAEAGFAALVTACVAGRLALTWACRASVPAARTDGLGATVAGTVRPSAPWLVTLAALLASAAFGLSADCRVWDGGPAALAREAAAWYAGSDARDLPPGLRYGDAAIYVEPIEIDEPPALGGMASSSSLPPGKAGLGLPAFLALPLGLLTGLAAALLLLRRTTRRLGGITGDVLGALVETATAATLVACALLG